MDKRLTSTTFLVPLDLGVQIREEIRASLDAAYSPPRMLPLIRATRAVRAVWAVRVRVDDNDTLT